LPRASPASIVSELKQRNTNMANAITIKTNKIPRKIIHWYELTDKERKDFNYLDTEQKQDEAEFMRYRGQVYNLHNMERGYGTSEIPAQFAPWDDYLSDSAFGGIGGIVIKWVDRGSRVIVGTWSY
jgi:hypothetical protein